MQQERKVFREYLESLFVALLIAFLLRAFVVGAYKIPTTSMAPSLKAGDLIFGNKLPFGLKLPFTDVTLLQAKLPERGDVIVFRFPEDERLSFIKRVIALPGDRIEIKNKHVYINGEALRYEPADSSEIGDMPGHENFMIQREYQGSKSHTVMFRRGEEGRNFGPETIPESEIFVMGDNRDLSDDSRSWGTVPLRNLEGHAVIIWMSLNWDNTLTKWGSLTLPSIRTSRIFHKIQ